MKEVWYLYGVKVTKEEFEMEPEKVDIKKYIINEKNMQRKMAWLNKVGMELFYKRMGKAKVLDEERNNKGEIVYQLLEFNNKDIFSRPVIYLYMRNPSVGVFHLEGINHNDLSAIQKELKKYGINVKEKSITCALHWRKPARMKEIPVDDVNGEEWCQQGDVCVWNKNAKALKLRPSVLT